MIHRCFRCTNFPYSTRSQLARLQQWPTHGETRVGFFFKFRIIEFAMFERVI